MRRLRARWQRVRVMLGNWLYGIRWHHLARTGRISRAQWLLRTLRSPAVARDALHAALLDEFVVRAIHAHAVEEVRTGSRFGLPKPQAPRCEGRTGVLVSTPDVFATRWGWSTEASVPLDDVQLGETIVATCLNCGLKMALPLSAMELPPDVIEQVKPLFGKSKAAIMGGHGQEPGREET